MEVYHKSYVASLTNIAQINGEDLNFFSVEAEILYLQRGRQEKIQNSKETGAILELRPQSQCLLLIITILLRLLIWSSLLSSSPSWSAMISRSIISTMAVIFNIVIIIIEDVIAVVFSLDSLSS